MIAKLPFITAAHYFGRCSSGNFWNTFECHRVRSDFAEIASDGFNTIILILPWAHFQPQTYPIKYNQNIIDRFKFVIDEARDAGLRIILRLGYLWDNSNAEIPTYQRYRQFFQNALILEAWKDFVSTIENIVGIDANDTVFFLSWEDPYWPVLRLPKDTPLEERVAYAKEIGLIDFMRRRYTFPLLQKIHGLSATSYDDLPAPVIEESNSLFAEFVLFFDREYIERWILETRAVLTHELWYEHRIDPDLDFIEHSTYKAGIACDLLYYHPKVGIPKAIPMNAKRAANHLKRTLVGFRQNNTRKRPLFLDQFNFKIDNPRFPDISMLADDDIPEFLAQCESIFRQHLIGYGIWGYSDWRDDKVFNGAFELGLSGWNLLGDYYFENSTKHGLVLKPGSILSQKIYKSGSVRLPRFYLEFDRPDAPLTVEIGNGNDVITLSITTDHTFIEGKLIRAGSNLKIRCLDGALCIRKVAYFSHVFTNGMRGIDGSSTAILQAISQLNRALSA